MAKAAIDAATGCLTLEAQKVFPLIVSDAPPQNGKTPEGKDAWAEIANGGRGVNFIRSGRSLARPWKLAEIDAQIAEERARLSGLARRKETVRLVQSMCARLPVRGAVRGVTSSRFESSTVHFCCRKHNMLWVSAGHW